MGVEWDTVEVLLEGLDEKTDRASVAMGKLVVAENVSFEAGRLDKRRGYRRMGLDEDVEGNDLTPGNLYCAATTVEDELVIFGFDELLSVVSPLDAVDDAGFVRRGPLARGTLTIQHVSTGS